MTHSLNYDAKLHRIRCQGHIINLALYSFLFVTDKENIDDHEYDIHKIKLADIEKWRRKGPLGKLHNFVVYIQGSIPRENKFLLLSHGKHLHRDNSTRWNSWYQMLKSCTSLKQAITNYYSKYIDEYCGPDQLTEQEWKDIQKIQDFLEKFEHCTLALEGHHSTIESVLVAMDYCLHIFEEAKRDYADDVFMSSCLNSGWDKFNKYYSKTSESPAYTAGLILHPLYKWQYLERTWDNEEWVKQAKDKVQGLWEREYKPGAPLPIQPPNSTYSTPNTSKNPNSFNAWATKQRLSVVNTNMDEYTRYCQAEPVFDIENLDPRKWWQEPTQQRLYPNLSKMALDILSIPAMSADPERLFSGAKLTLTDLRNRLGIEAIQALESLKSWWRLDEWCADNLSNLPEIKLAREGYT